MEVRLVGLVGLRGKDRLGYVGSGVGFRFKLDWVEFGLVRFGFEFEFGFGMVLVLVFSSVGLGLGFGFGLVLGLSLGLDLGLSWAGLGFAGLVPSVTDGTSKYSTL